VVDGPHPVVGARMVLGAALVEHVDLPAGEDIPSAMLGAVRLGPSPADPRPTDVIWLSLLSPNDRLKMKCRSVTAMPSVRVGTGKARPARCSPPKASTRYG
jgi:hypothetical protein